MSSSPPIVVAAEDRIRLLQLVASAGTEVTEQLDIELERARVLPLAEIPDDVIVMNSELEYEDATTRRRRRLRLVYPHEADSSAGRVSIMAPLGCALLGLRIGQEIDWRMPGGPRRIRVLSVTRSESRVE